MILALAILCFFCALVPAVMFAVNLRYYVPPPGLSGERAKAISVLIPARNEAAGIVDAVRAILVSRDVCDGSHRDGRRVDGRNRPHGAGACG